MRINHNIAALKANSTLNRNTKSMNSSLEKLSSGYRINRAADDAAGMAISQKMRTQIRGLDRASDNAADGISVLQTAEGALAEVESIVQRMRELSVQAANDTNTVTDRQAIQDEIDELNDEITRISQTTEFNTKTLLDGSVDRKSYSDQSSVQIISLSDEVFTKDYEVSVTANPEQASYVGSGITSIDAITAAEAGTININGESITISENDTIDMVYEKIRTVAGYTNVNVFLTEGTLTEGSEYAGYETTSVADASVGTKLGFSTIEYGSNKTVEIHCDNQKLAAKLGISTSVKEEGADAAVSLGTGFSNTATHSISGNVVTVTDNGGFEMKIKINPNTLNNTTTKLDAKISVLTAGPITLQVGSSENQTMTVAIPKVDPSTLEIDNVNVCTQEGASEAISLFDNAISDISAIRAKLGACQNRLEYCISNLDTASENMTEAMSRIEDVDMAGEMATYTQYNVLVQAGTSMLAQANELPQTVLTLLQG